MLPIRAIEHLRIGFQQCFVLYDHHLIFGIKCATPFQWYPLLVRMPELQEAVMEVHEGMLRAARNILQTIAPTLLKALAAHPDYDLVVTGHSLGVPLTS